MNEMIKNSPAIGDILAIPLFFVGIVYFANEIFYPEDDNNDIAFMGFSRPCRYSAKKQKKYMIQILLFLFCIGGFIADVFFTFLYMNRR
jgi:hypothetical protein